MALNARELDNVAVEYEPKFSYYLVGLILFAAVDGALYLLGVRGWWFALGVLAALVVWTRYRWNTGLREEYRERYLERLERARQSASSETEPPPKDGEGP